MIFAQTLSDEGIFASGIAAKMGFIRLEKVRHDMDDLLRQAKPYDENKRPVGVHIRDGMLFVSLYDGRVIGTPLDWYPTLMKATSEQIAQVEFSSVGLHWEALDEDLSVEGMLAGIRPLGKHKTVFS